MKNLFLCLIAMFCVGIAANAQSTVPGFKTIKLEFGRRASYMGICVNGQGVCITPVSNPTSSTQAYTGIAKSSLPGKIIVVFNEQFIRENNTYLSGGAIVIGEDHPLAKEVSESIGISGIYTMRTGSYIYAYNNGYYYCTMN